MLENRTMIKVCGMSRRKDVEFAVQGRSIWIR